MSEQKPNYPTLKEKEHREKVTLVTLLSGHLTGMFRARMVRLEELDAQCAALAGTTCTGETFWADKKSKNPKMKVMHKTGADCPLHGPARGKVRTVSYVGTKTTKQDAAERAISDHITLGSLEKQRDALARRLTRAENSLKSFYTELGYTHPQRRADGGAPEPIANWKPDEYARNRGWN